MLNIDEKENLFLSEIIKQRKQNVNLIISQYKQIHSFNYNNKKIFIFKIPFIKKKKSSRKNNINNKKLFNS